MIPTTGTRRLLRDSNPGVSSTGEDSDGAEESGSDDSYEDLESDSFENDQMDKKMEEQELQKTVEVTKKAHGPPLRVIIDGEIYSRRKIAGNREYFYCIRQAKGCRAGFVRNSDTGCYVRNKHPHTHERDSEQVAHENEAEISFRLFIQDHINMDSREIYSLILKDDFGAQHQYEFFPDIKSIDIKRIQNTKYLLGGPQARNVLQSLLHPSLAELNGVGFLAMQTVRPPILLFATRAQLAILCSAGTCMVKRLNITGSLIRFVYCVYAVNPDQVVPVAWILSSDRDSFLWSQFRSFLSCCKESAHARKLWVVPCGKSYLNVVANLASQTAGRAAGIQLSYTRKVEKIIQNIRDNEMHEALKQLFLDMRTEKIHMIQWKVNEAEIAFDSVEAKQAIRYWRTIYQNQTFMYHRDATLNNPHVDRVYAEVKQTPAKIFGTDTEVISFIHNLAQ